MKNITAFSVLLRLTLMILPLALFSVTSAQAQSATLIKEFLSEPVQGATVEIQYTLTNNTNSFLQTVGFSDNLDDALTGMTSLGAASNTCGGNVSGSSTMTFSRSFMPAMSSCSLTVLAQTPSGATPGTYPGATSTVDGTIFGGAAFSDPGASADLQVRSILLFEKSFIDDPVISGESVILEFTLTNQSALETLTDITFTDDLDGIDPALIGLVANGLPLTNICGFGQIDGTNLLTFLDGRLSPLQTCSFQVELILPASVPMGSYTNTTSNIGFNVGMNPILSSPASDDLRVGLPTLTKSFTDDPVFPGEEVTLEFTITNINPNESFTQIGFTDDLDAALSGMDVQTLPLDGFCGTGSTITGMTELTIAGGSLAPLASCTFSVSLNVPNDAPNGIHLNTTSNLSVEAAPMAFHVGESASDNLNVIGIPVLTKTFTDDPAQPGEQVTLEFSISNLNRLDSSTNISFTDDLDATLSGLVATGLPLADPCGSGSTLSGTSLLTLTGAGLGPEGTCTFSVTLDVPASTIPGTYPNTTSPLTSNVGGTAVSGDTASDSLVVGPATLITLDWSDDPVAAGSTATMDITLTNSSIVDTASDMSFELIFHEGLPTAATPTTTCDGDVVFTQRTNPPAPSSATPASINYGFVTPGTLTPGASCTIQVVLDVAPDLSTGVYLHTSSGVTSTVDTITYTGPPGSDDLLVVGGPTLSMVFTDDPTIPGDLANLELTLTHEELASTDATNIAFSIDLDGVITGMVGSGLPQNNICGPGSSISGTGLLTFSLGTLAPDASCTFNVSVLVPLVTVPGVWPFISSDVASTVSGISVTGPQGNDELTVAGFIVTKEFLTSPVIPGGSVALEFTFTNLSPTETATVLVPFQDDLDDALPGMTATSLPANDLCGPGSSVTGTSVLTFSGIIVVPNSSCSLQVTVQVPVGTPVGPYTNVTASQFVSLGTEIVTGPPAIDTLEVEQPLSLIKTFTTNPVNAGLNVTLEFTIDNESATHTITNIAFTDDLDDALTGLAATVLPPANPCGIGSSLSGTDLLTFTGGSLAPATSCTFSVTLLVPPGTPDSSSTNTSSNITGDVGSIILTGTPATDTLTVVSSTPPSFAKAFSPTIINALDISTLTFTIDNGTEVNNVSDLNFTDNLPAGLIVAAIPNGTTDCFGGTLTAAPGTAVISYTGGGALAATSCTVSVDITSAMAGTHVNTTGDLTSSFGNSGTATDTLGVNPSADVSVTKDDGVTSAKPGQSVTYSIVVANAGPSTDPSVTLSDTFPNPPLTCTYTSTAAGGATGNTAAGAGNLSETLSMPAGSSVTYSAICAINSNATGTLSNTATATPSVHDPLPGNNSDTDGDTVLEPEADLLITKTDGVTSAVPGDTTLVYTIIAGNAGSSDDPSVSVSDIFPADLTCSYTSVAAGGATGNTNGSGNLAETLSMPTGSSVTYTASCTIAASATGTLSNTATVSGSVTDPVPGNNSATDDDTVLEPEADLSITKTDGVTSAVPGQTTLTYTIVASNGGSGDDPSVSLVDTFPTDLTCSYTSVTAGGASGNTAAGAGNLSETLSMPTGSSVTYTASCTIDSSATGTLSNTATVSGSVTDPVPGNNSATDGDTVLEPEADLLITKTDGVTSAVPGDTTLVYTIVAGNAGSSDDPSVSVSDTFPTDLTCSYTSVATGGASGNTAAGSGDLAETLSMPSGSSVTYTASCTIDPSATGTLSNTATVSGTVTDPVPGNNSATDDDTALEPAADLSITKTDGVTSAVPGQTTLTYTIVASNGGSSDDPSVSVSDTFPADLTCSYTSVAAGGATGNTNGAGNLAETLSMPAGSSVTYTASCTIDPSATGTLSNTAMVSGSVTDPVPGNNSATDDDTALEPAADLSITKTDGVTSAVPGQTTLTYTIVAGNAGSSDDPSVSLVDTFPTDLTCSYTSVAAGGTTGNTNGAGNLADTLSMPTGSSVTYTASCTIAASATGTLSNTATVSGSVTDSVPGNNSATDDDTALEPTADLSITKTDGVTSAVPGDTTLVYTIVAGNAGSSDDPSVTVSDTFPADLTCSYTSVAAGGTTGNTNGAGNLAETLSMPAGGSVTYTASCTIAASATGTLSNTATVSGSVTDPVPGNNSATDDDTALEPEADLSITKTDGVTSAVPGQTTLTYTIVASNGGSGDDPSVSLVDTFPTDLTCSYTSVAAGGASGNTAAGSGDLAETLSMPAGGSVTYTASCTIAASATGTLSNTATVSGSVTDPVPGNNSATDDDTILAPEFDLTISKSDGVTSAVPGVTTLVYTIVAGNAGPSANTAVLVEDIFPVDLSCNYTSVAAGGATGNSSGSGDLTETLSMPSGSSVTYTASCTIDPSATGTLVNTATIAESVSAGNLSVSSTLADPNSGNNSATDDDTELFPEADLSVSKDDGLTSATPGETIVVYTIVAANEGPSTDAAVHLTDILPFPLSCTFTSVATGGANGNTSAGSGNLDEMLILPPDSDVTYTLTCTIRYWATGLLTNTAEVSGGAFDPDEGNNSATDGDTELIPKPVIPIPTLSIWMMLLMALLLASLGYRFLRPMNARVS